MQQHKVHAACVVGTTKVLAKRPAGVHSKRHHSAQLAEHILELTVRLSLPKFGYNGWARLSTVRGGTFKLAPKTGCSTECKYVSTARSQLIAREQENPM